MSPTTPDSSPEPSPEEISRGLAELERHLARQAPAVPAAVNTKVFVDARGSQRPSGELRTGERAPARVWRGDPQRRRSDDSCTDGPSGGDDARSGGRDGGSGDGGSRRHAELPDSMCRPTMSIRSVVSVVYLAAMGAAGMLVAARRFDKLLLH